MLKRFAFFCVVVAILAAVNRFVALPEAPIRARASAGPGPVVTSSPHAPKASRGTAAGTPVRPAVPSQPGSTARPPREAIALAAPMPAQAVAAPEPCDGAIQPGTLVTVRDDAAPVFIQPAEGDQALSRLPSGSVVPVKARADQWVLITFQDRRWGPRVGYIACRQVGAAGSRHGELENTETR